MEPFVISSNRTTTEREGLRESLVGARGRHLCDVFGVREVG